MILHSNLSSPNMNSCQENSNDKHKQVTGPLSVTFFAGLILSLCFIFPTLRHSEKIVFIQAEKLNSNTASVYKLAELPSLGPKKAQQIIDYRQRYVVEGKEKAFKTAEDMENIKGIGGKTIDKIRQWLVFE